MRTKDIQELKNKPASELEKDLPIYREKLRELRFDLAAGKVKNVSEIKKVRQAIARILTFIKQKGDN